jgi:hypothetical protein
MDMTEKARRLLCVILAGLLIFLSAPLWAAETDSDVPAGDDTQEVSTSDDLPEEQTDAGQSEEAASAEPSLDESSFDETVHQESLAAPEASVFTGSSTYKVSIRVPPARALTPEIVLTYNSHRSNSWAGVGVDLTMGAVQRSTKKGLDYNGTDFVTITPDSKFELARRPGWCTDCYGAKVEESFTRYERLYDNARYDWIEPAADGSWVATTKDGTKYFYGTGPASRQENAYGTFKWLL